MRQGRLLWGVMGLLLTVPAFGFGGEPDRGARTYRQQCEVCHGPDGTGNSGMAANFREEWHRLSKPDEELIRMLRTGPQPGDRDACTVGPVPPGLLSDRDLRDVLEYIRRNLAN